jgi:hypothetical protein
MFPMSALRTWARTEIVEAIRSQSYGKDAGFACLENASGVSHFATASTTG